jgi:hypothetical protein
MTGLKQVFSIKCSVFSVQCSVKTLNFTYGV